MMDTQPNDSSHDSEEVAPELVSETDAPQTGGEEVCADQPLASRIEALLLSSDRPLTEGRIGQLLGVQGKGSVQRLRDAIAELNEQYVQTGRAFRVEKLAGGWQMLTVEAFGPILARLHVDRQQSKLSQAALETLAIISYQQPIMRAEIEAIRGVAAGEVLRGLLERRLIKIVGRAEELGRPMLYGTTREFLKVFGMSGLDDLPIVEGLNDRLKQPRQQREQQAPGTEAADDSTEEAERRPEVIETLGTGGVALQGVRAN